MSVILDILCRLAVVSAAVSYLRLVRNMATAIRTMPQANCKVSVIVVGDSLSANSK